VRTIDPGGRGLDFSFYQERIPGLFVLLGARAAGDEFIRNHSPKFKLDESSILVGVRTLAHLALDYMLGAQRPRKD
jgi:metal-dependent amidase/aminoacylase/carboxypeptidase family protein